ncbi:ABC transporter substrate-binding protein [Allorhizocola rhizosphaerae]|uniref:ABC transporter substrate-binding protein n=1 Tax=Allorhizocola rhizosphaerae TaxID=1872709 RepID=UPI000E3E89F4|nr:ABC transporter substrate-binding protein [Allorhizocola rhizosphaerae]
MSRLTALAIAAALTLGTAACSEGSQASQPLRLGYFPNITHAPALVGLEKGFFTNVQTSTFNAGPAAIEALFSGAIDATYIGPNPAINAHAKSNGEAIRIVAGAASGGVALVVRPGINSAEDLRGKRIATPQLGNTQDVAVRHWLKGKGLTTTKEGGGDVKIIPQENAQTVETFGTGAIDGAWVPEPFVSRLVSAGGKILVDERDLWPGRQFVIAHLIVRTEFLTRYPEKVKKLIEEHVAVTEFINAKPDEAQQAVSDHIGKLSGKPLDRKLIQQSWPSLTFLDDPLATSLKVGADHAVEIGLLEKVDLNGIYDLKLLNEVLRAAGKPEVKGL